MKRHFPNWIQGYMSLTSHLEALDMFHVWSAISAISGALGGKCWLDMGHFIWKPNFFIVFVAPPGVVQKSTSSGISAGLLRSVEGVHFGPDSMTWQALTDSFRDAETTYPEIGKKVSALCIVASEVGTFLDPTNRELIDILNDLWDGRDVPWKRRTKGEGETKINNPCLTFIGCTTPAWLQSFFPQYAIGGGFTSRTVFVYGDTKRFLNAYPGDTMQQSGMDIPKVRKQLIEDLKQIKNIKGQFELTPEAKAFGKEWYEEHWKLNLASDIDKEIHGGYISRKQTHIHKIAMVISAAESNDKIITAEHLVTAKELITACEPGFAKVFTSISDNREVHYLSTLLRSVRAAPETSKVALWKKMSAIMTLDQFEAAIEGALRADFIREFSNGSAIYYRPQSEQPVANTKTERLVRLATPSLGESEVELSDEEKLESSQRKVATGD